MKTVVITGAGGNLGAKLRVALTGRYALRLIDKQSHDDADIAACDLGVWSDAWADLCNGAEALVHLAANARAEATWDDLLEPNIDALLNVLHACVRGGVRRVILASSNHVMGGYQHDSRPGSVTTDLTPRPGTKYFARGADRDSSPYAATKLFAERAGRWYAERFGLSVIAVRIGWVRPGANSVADLPADRGDWFRHMYLSNRDYCRLLDCCVEAEAALGFDVVKGMSYKLGMAWVLVDTREVVGYVPQDGWRG